MKYALKRIAIGFLSLIVLLYVVYQGYVRISNPYRTEIVLRYSVSDSLSAKGIVLRDEQLLDSADGLAIDYLFDDGERVAKNSVVARLYNSKSDIADKDVIAKLEADLELLEQSQAASSDFITNADSTSKQILSKLVSYANLCEGRFVGDIASYKNSFLLSLNKRLSSTEGKIDYNSQIKELESQIKQYKNNYGTSVSSVRTPQAGYFVSCTDGYESILTTDGRLNLSFEKYSELITKKIISTRSDTVGKIITEPHWYLAVDVPAQSAESLYIGRTVDIDFPFSTIETVEATVSDIITSASSDRIIVLLKSSAMSPNLAVTRNCTVQINFRTVTGLRLNSKAIRFNGQNEQGVYIISGEQIKFKKIDIIYEGNGFCLTRYNDSDDEYLQFYDEVIVEGKGLYDSKLL